MQRRFQIHQRKHPGRNWMFCELTLWSDSRVIHIAGNFNKEISHWKMLICNNQKPWVAPCQFHQSWRVTGKASPIQGRSYRGEYSRVACCLECQTPTIESFPWSGKQRSLKLRNFFLHRRMPCQCIGCSRMCLIWKTSERFQLHHDEERAASKLCRKAIPTPNSIHTRPSSSVKHQWKKECSHPSLCSLKQVARLQRH